MPSFSVTYRYGFLPRGVWIKFSHSEACTITKNIPKSTTKMLQFLDIPSAVTKIIAAFLPVAEIAREVLSVILEIKKKNETSSREGVKIFFNLFRLEITKVNRRGKKRVSRCS